MANEPNDYSESDPTQYANYGGSGEAYSEYTGPTYPEPAGYGQAPAPIPPKRPWNQNPLALVALGVLSAAILALLVYAVVRFTNSGTSSPSGTSTATSTTSVTSAESATSGSAAPAPAPTTETITESPTHTETVTTTVTPPTTTTTTTAAPVTTTTQAPSTTTTISTSVTTITETTTKPFWPTLPTLKPPTLLQPPSQG